MANYGALIQDNGDGSFIILALNRGTTTSSFSGGTNLLTNTFSQNVATGALTSASGFLVSATDVGDGLGHKMHSPMEALERANAIIRNDRAFNG